MPYKCKMCGKGTSSGNKKDYRGMPKAKGGVGLKITGKTKRTFRPNLQSMRVKINGGVSRMYVCTACLRSGKVERV